MQPQGARVVTPEAVVLDVQTAGLGSRAFARAIDGLIQGAALTAVLVITGAVLASTSSGLGTAGFVVELVTITVVLFGYPIIWESLWRGRTPGKAALGLRVVTRQGAPIRFRHALVRGLVGLGEVLALPVIGVISMLVSANDQRLGDMAAGTIVIRERAATQLSRPVVFYPPPGWESFVESLDVGALTSGEYETVRSFLIRAPHMALLPRNNLAARLAGPLATRWHLPVPQGAGPELWLACIACAYQRRHGAPVGGYGPGGYGPGGYGAGGDGAGGYGAGGYGAGAGAYGAGGWGPPHPATRLGGPAGAAARQDAPPTAPVPPRSIPPVVVNDGFAAPD